MNVYSLLVDLGGTDIKFALADGNKLLEETITRRGFPPFLDDESKSFEPESLIRMIHQGIDSYTDISIKPKRILLTGQMGSWIATTHSGDYQSDVLSWQASSPVSRDFLKTLYEPNFVSENKPLLGTGSEDWPGAPWRTFAAHLSNQLPSSSRILFHTLLSWVAWELTGRTERIIHNSDAAATGLFNLIDHDWLGDFNSAGFAVEFPKVSTNLCKVGFYNGSGIPVYVGIGDQQASLIGAGLEDSLYIINAGTGGQVARQVKSLTSGPFKTRPFFEGSYLETITHIPSGRYLSRLREFLNTKRDENRDWKWIWERGLLDDASEAEFLIQDWDIETFLDDHHDTDSTVLADSIVRGISRKFIESLIVIGCEKGDTVLLAGGVASNLKCLWQMLEETGFEVIQSKSKESTLDGLAKLTEILID